MFYEHFSLFRSFLAIQWFFVFPKVVNKLIVILASEKIYAKKYKQQSRLMKKPVDFIHKFWQLFVSSIFLRLHFLFIKSLYTHTHLEPLKLYNYLINMRKQIRLKFQVWEQLSRKQKQFFYVEKGKTSLINLMDLCNRSFERDKKKTFCII